MIKRTVIWVVCGLVFVGALPFSASADQSIGYKQYFNEGVMAFKEHDNQKALRCFKIAHIYDPASKEVDHYLEILSPKQVVISSTENLEPQLSEEIIFYEKEKQAIAAIEKKISKTISNVESQTQAYSPPAKFQPTAALPQQAAVVPQPIAVMPQPTAVVPQPAAVEPQPTAAVSQAVATVPMVQAEPQPVAAIAQPSAVYVAGLKPKQPPAVILLDSITNNGQIKPKLQIEYHSSVIIEGRNIQRFLAVDDGFLGVKIIDTDHLEIDALKVGTTFLHIWDNGGRNTLYVEVVFPKSVDSSGTSQSMNGIHHGEPFKFTYTNDWTTYYSGQNIAQLKRESYDFNQTMAVSGETPYGFFDTSGSYSDVDSISGFDTYTVGLSQIPVEGTSNFDLRGFDAFRYLSPLTLPGATLRGAFADVDLWDDILGLSVSHGQQRETQGFFLTGGNQVSDSYIDAAKLTLFPKSNEDRYSFNFATAYGPDRLGYLSNHVYSIEGQHQFNDFLTLNAEQATDSSHDSSLASLKWQDGTFRSGFNFRNIDKDYSTISALPSYQGETGADWTTEGDFSKFTETTFVEAYRDRLDFNPDDPSALNYDANGHLRAYITPDLWSDSDFNYQDTAGEASPASSLGFNERLSKSFGVWNSMKGTVFTGTGYQNSHSPQSDTSDFNREDVIAGIQLPLTRQISLNANYEYDWLNQPYSGGNSNPSVINAGLEYQKQITSKISFNSSVDYHDELGVEANSNSFLSGEESVIVTSGFNYSPTQDMSIFADSNASKILSHIGNPSYDDFEVHVGMRITFGGSTYWDPMGIVSGIIFKDRNGDGKYVSGDEGIPGVKMKVGDKEVTTDKYGRYSVQIRAKSVDVTPVLDTVPGGLLFSTPQTLNVRVFQGRRVHADFGLISQTGIYGLVFVPSNTANIPSDGDKFIGRVRVILDGKITQKSDSHGAFYFRKVTPGEHTISIDLNTLALNIVPLVKLKNKIDVAEGTNYMFNIPVQIKQAEDDQN